MVTASFIEYCPSCDPQCDYVRAFDVSVTSRPRWASLLHICISKGPFRFPRRDNIPSTHCTKFLPPIRYCILFLIARRHQTGRVCDACGAALLDTIVHFGETGGAVATTNWSAALQHSQVCAL